MKPTYRTCHRKVANWLVLLTIATFLLSGIALPTAQAAPQARQTAAARGVNQSAAPAANCTDVSLVASEDTYLSANDVTYNNGGNTAIHVDGTTGTARRTALLKWDLSSIPSNATVSSASLSLYVTDASTVLTTYINETDLGRGHGLKPPRQPVPTGTPMMASTVGGQLAPLTQLGPLRHESVGRNHKQLFHRNSSTTVALNTEGVAVVQGWIAGSTSNYGLIIQTYSGSTNALYFSSSEATTAANRPKLNLSYCVHRSHHQHHAARWRPSPPNRERLNRPDLHGLGQQPDRYIVINAPTVLSSPPMA